MRFEQPNFNVPEQENNESNEQKIKDRLYKSVQEMYEYVMFSGGERWLGYSASVGFDVSDIGYFEPPLQKLLSLIHQKLEESSSDEYTNLIERSVSALREFDYKKEIMDSFHDEFVELGCPEIIEHVASELEKAVGDVKNM